MPSRLKAPRPSGADARFLLGIISGTLWRPYRPLMANLIVIRRCNLSCAYCAEFDHFSPPVPLAVLKGRIDQLARLRTVIVSLTGGEPLLHPDIAELVRYVRERGMTPMMSTNGYLLTEAVIDSLNAAGLYVMQLSLDGTNPRPATEKVLRTLAPKMRLLAGRARFRVRVNTVLGAAPPEEALEAVRIATAHGFEAKCSLLRGKDGRVADFDARTKAIYEEICRLEGRRLGICGESFQDALVREGRVDWKCRAGARFFHVSEDGRVDLCAPRAGVPGKPLEDYTEADIRLAFHAPKTCAAHCPVAYAHLLSRGDGLRGQDGEPYPR